MPTIERFEDIQAWQKGRELCKLVYGLTQQGAFSRDFGLKDQMRRAAVSIISNIAEGYEGQNNRIFIRYLYIARGSAGEVRSQAYIVLDQGYISQQAFDDLYALTKDIARLLTRLIQYLEKNTNR